MTVCHPKSKQYSQTRKIHEEFQKLLLLSGFLPFFVSFFSLDLRSQTDVEEYLGGADADVEVTLKSFQDALAYAFFFSISIFSSVKDIHLIGSAASTVIWTQV